MGSHHLSAKYSVIRYLRKAHTNCKYPKWALYRVEKRLTRSADEVNDEANSQHTAGTPSNTNEVKPRVTYLYHTLRVSLEVLKNICGRYGIQTHFKGNSTIKSLLVSPKDKDPMVNKSGAIYWFECGDLTCDDE